jgi:CRP-like cAMP-binding protein
MQMEDLIQKGKERFPYLSEEQLIEFLGMGELVSLAEGEIFSKAGNREERAAFVLQGLLRNYIITDDGDEVTVVFATEMQGLAPYSSVFLNEPATETTEAVQPSLVLAMNVKTMREKAHKDVSYARVYTDIIEQALMAAIGRIEDFTKRSPEQRYQALLDRHGYLIEQVPLKYLASYIGVNAVSLSRIRKRVATAHKRPKQA